MAKVPHDPKANIFKQKKTSPAMKSYAKELNRLMGRGAEAPEARARTQQFGTIGRQTQEQVRQSRMGEAGAFGGNVTSGFGNAQRSQIYGDAPYGAANIAAENAGINQLQALGKSATNLTMAKGGYQNMLMGLAIQQQIADFQENLAGAQAGALGAEPDQGIISEALGWLI